MQNCHSCFKHGRLKQRLLRIAKDGLA